MDVEVNRKELSAIINNGNVLEQYHLSSPVKKNAECNLPQKQRAKLLFVAQK
jgi:hypothetical protein